jgi:hypothetical protein
LTFLFTGRKKSVFLYTFADKIKTQQNDKRKISTI